MTKQKKQDIAKEAAENWDDAAGPGTLNPDPAKSTTEGRPPQTPSEPTDKVSKDDAKATLTSAAAGLPVDPKSDEVAKRLKEIADKLPPRPKNALVEAYKATALVVGAEKAKRMLVDEYGTEEPEKLKASQLLDAIDALYGAA